MKIYKTLNQIFREREKYIPLVERQLKKKNLFSVESDGNIFDLNLDFRHIGIPDFFKLSSLPIILLQGWGSGWEGIVPLAFSLACEGYEVFLISLPGYGDTENPPKEYYQHNFFLHSASAIQQFCCLSNFAPYFKNGAYFVGHSMGTQVVSEVAREFPYLVKKLVLLNPSGVDSYGFFGKIALNWRFILSGIKMRREYQKKLKASGESDCMQPLIDWCGKQKSPFWGRLSQRLAEFQAICQGTLSETLEQIDNSVPMVFLWGAEDSVFPVTYQEVKEIQIVGDLLEKIKSKAAYLAGVPHNPTLFHSEITAAAITHYLEG